MNHQSVKQLDIKVEGTFPSHQSDIRFDIGRQSYNYMYKNEGYYIYKFIYVCV